MRNTIKNNQNILKNVSGIFLGVLLIYLGFTVVRDKKILPKPGNGLIQISDQTAPFVGGIVILNGCYVLFLACKAAFIRRQ